MNGQCLWIGVARRFQRDGESAVVVFQGSGRQVPRDDFADPVVEDLDVILDHAARCRARQVRRAQLVQHGGLFGAQGGGPAGVCLLQRLAGHCQDFQEPPGRAGQSQQARPQDPVQGEAARLVRQLGPRPKVLHQRGHKQRVAARLAGNGAGMGLQGRVVLPEQGAGQLLRLSGSEHVHVHLPPVERGVRPGRQLADRGQERAGLGCLAPIAAQQEKNGRIGRSQQLGDQQRTIEIAPLEVVDGQYQRPLCIETRDRAPDAVKATPVIPVGQASRE